MRSILGRHICLALRPARSRAAGVKAPHGREEGPAMTAYLQGMWRCRYFWLSLVKMDLRARYRGSVFGLGWSLLHPVAMTIIFTTIFCRLFHQDPRYYAPYVLTGLAFWNFLLQSTLQGCDAFFRGESY